MASAESERVEKPHHQHYLNDFRVEACALFKQHQCQQHRPYTCFNWHFANQRRRRPVKKPNGSFNYSPDIYCDKYDENTGICPDGDECLYLHRVSGDVERKYHLRYYKTAQCVHPTDPKGHCVKNGAHCAFAHSNSDLRQPLFDQFHETLYSTNMEGEARDRTSFVIEDQAWHSQDHVLSCYKTEQCRKPARLCRQGYACPFYHNSKDRRRPPALYKYRSTPCPAAKTVDEWLDPELCEAGDNCQYCHTRTEQQFHPEIYKSTKCNDMLEHGYCPRAVFCAFAHHDSELHVTRTPYALPASSSPKEPSSPTSTTAVPATTTTAASTTQTSSNSEAATFGSPVSNGSATPSYSAVLKQRHNPPQPQATPKQPDPTPAAPSSYPKAPGFERQGPLSPGRANSELVRNRTQSLNMGPMDIKAKKEYTGTSSTAGLDSSTGTSLPSYSSLCRSESGFHVNEPSNLSSNLEELSLDLTPINEHNSHSISDLFGGISSPMRQMVTGDSYHTSPITSFGEGLFKPNSPSNMFGFENQVAIWEEGLKQARQACEAWREEAQHYKGKAEQAELERNRACFERDQLAQQLESLKMHFTSATIAANMSGPGPAQHGVPAVVNPNPILNTPSEFTDEVMRAAARMHNHQQNAFSVFSNEQERIFCPSCGRDRRQNDGHTGCTLCS